jgi:YesN/AraC family two-component response regulator
MDTGELEREAMERTHCLIQELGTQLRKLSRAAFPGRILIVDEEGEHYRKPLATFLPECRFTVVACQTTAKRYFLSSPIDLVILDHSPQFSCLELLPAFKLFRPSIPVVVVTGCGSEELAVQAFRHGAIDYFRKPFDVRDLESTVRAMLEFRRQRREKEPPQPVSGLQRALRFIERNFRSQLKLEQAANEAGMSISCFERHLKQRTGMSFTAYVNGLRIARARELLGMTSSSMLQIALTCGFGNQSHFNRVFKRITGLTPGEYRKTAPVDPRDPEPLLQVEAFGTIPR